LSLIFRSAADSISLILAASYAHTFSYWLVVGQRLILNAIYYSRSIETQTLVDERLIAVLRFHDFLICALGHIYQASQPRSRSMVWAFIYRLVGQVWRGAALVCLWRWHLGVLENETVDASLIWSSMDERGSGLINGLLVAMPFLALAIVLFRSSGRFIGDASLDSGPVQLKGEQLNETSE
jgi:hypothetical protein